MVSKNNLLKDLPARSRIWRPASAYAPRLARSLDITSDGFGMEADITGKLLAPRIGPFEVPITNRRTVVNEGNHLTRRDTGDVDPDRTAGIRPDGPGHEQARVT
jgi:hypothetical protein